MAWRFGAFVALPALALTTASLVAAPRSPFATPHQAYDLNPGGYGWPVDVPDLPSIGDAAPDSLPSQSWIACAGRRITLYNRTDARRTIYISTTESVSETLSSRAKRERLVSDIAAVAPPHRARFKPYFHKYPSLEVAVLGLDDDVSFIPRAATTYWVEDGDVWYVAIKAKRCGAPASRAKVSAR